MMGERLSDRSHPERIVEHLAIDVEVTLDGCDFLGRAGGGDDRRPEADARSLDGAFVDLRHSRRVREDQFDPPGSRQTPEAALRMEIATVRASGSPLAVGQERLARVGDGHRLVVVERLDGRILTVTLTLPGADQEGERLEVGMESEYHLTIFAPGRPAVPRALSPLAPHHRTPEGADRDVRCARQTCLGGEEAPIPVYRAITPTGPHVSRRKARLRLVRKQYHFWRDDNRRDAWDVHRLIELTKDLSVRQVELFSIDEVDTEYWFGHGTERPTVRAVLDRLRLVQPVDPSYPVILGVDERVIDGMHRIAPDAGRPFFDLGRAVQDDSRTGLPGRQARGSPLLILVPEPHAPKSRLIPQGCRTEHPEGGQPRKKHRRSVCSFHPLDCQKPLTGVSSTTTTVWRRRALFPAYRASGRMLGRQASPCLRCDGATNSR
jgi:hypothetical protein